MPNLKQPARKRLGALLLCALCIPCAHADLKVQVKESINGGKPIAVTHWFGGDRSMRDDGSRYIITNLRASETTIVNRATHTYQVVPLKLLPDAQLPEVFVTRTDDTRKIGPWMTRRYHLTGPATRDLKINIWVTEDLKLDFSAFHTLMVALGNRSGSAWLKAYKTIDGFPVLQQVELARPGITLRSQSKVVAISNVESVPNDTYRPPENYILQP